MIKRTLNCSLIAMTIACGGNLGNQPEGDDDSGNPTQNDAGTVLDGDVQGVTRNGFTWTNIGPQGADLYGVWGSSSSDVWFVGAAGVILHFDGASFSAPDSPTGEELRAVWGSAANDVWAVGRPYWDDPGEAPILHFDGNSWTVVQTISGGELYSVWGTASDDVWAVGGKGLTVHFDGATWTTITSPTPNDLAGVWSSSSTNVWAVGSTSPEPIGPTIIKWTGTSWVTMPAPDDARGSFNHVWGSSDGDVWLAGSAQIDKEAPSLDPSGYVIHWNGNGWDPPFIVNSFASPLRSIFGSSPNHVETVGSASAIESFDGSNWSPHNLPGDFESVWESAPNDIWCVGLGGVMAHFDGTNWTELTPPPPSWGEYTAAAMWVNSASDAWIGANGPTSAELSHWDGHAWTTSSISATSPAWIYFYNMWGTSPTNMWAVGSGPAPKSGRITHFDGTAWTTIFDQAGNYDFLGVWGASENDVWFSGGSGTLVHWDGTQMTTMSLSTQDQLWSIQGSSSTDVWMVGNTNEDLTMRHWNGASWATTFTGPGVVNDMWLASANDIWGVGWESNTALHYDGSTWTNIAIPREVGSIWGSASNDIWAVGFFGASIHYDGNTWTPVALTESTFAAVGGSSASDVWMVTTAGAILHHP